MMRLSLRAKITTTLAPSTLFLMPNTTIIAIIAIIAIIIVATARIVPPNNIPHTSTITFSTTINTDINTNITKTMAPTTTNVQIQIMVTHIGVV